MATPTTPDKPHGWSTTRTGIMMHYFGLTHAGEQPLALCHNAIRRGEGHGWYARVPHGMEQCASCADKLESWQKNERRQAHIDAATENNRLAPGVAVSVTRGRYKGRDLSGRQGEVYRRHETQATFWYVVLFEENGRPGPKIALSESQLSITQR